MQSAKDSFYVTLRSRLDAANPERVVIVDEVEVPAILVRENEAVTFAKPLDNCFYVSFGKASLVPGCEGSGLMAMDVDIKYQTRGTSDAGSDRGRSLAALDADLLAICSPAYCAKNDYTKDPAVDLRTNVFWTRPLLQQSESDGTSVSRSAALTLYFYPEATTL